MQIMTFVVPRAEWVKNTAWGDLSLRCVCVCWGYKNNSAHNYKNLYILATSKTKLNILLIKSQLNSTTILNIYNQYYHYTIKTISKTIPIYLLKQTYLTTI